MFLRQATVVRSMGFHPPDSVSRCSGPHGPSSWVSRFCRGRRVSQNNRQGLLVMLSREAGSRNSRNLLTVARRRGEGQEDQPQTWRTQSAQSCTDLPRHAAYSAYSAFALPCVILNVRGLRAGCCGQRPTMDSGLARDRSQQSFHTRPLAHLVALWLEGCPNGHASPCSSKA